MLEGFSLNITAMLSILISPTRPNSRVGLLPVARSHLRSRQTGETSWSLCASVRNVVLASMTSMSQRPNFESVHVSDIG